MNAQKTFINLGTFKRYELMVYVTNRSGNSKVFNPRQTSFGTRDQDLLAHFDCLNATGAKLTSKTIAIRARPASTPYEASVKPTPGERSDSYKRPIHYWLGICLKMAKQ